MLRRFLYSWVVRFAVILPVVHAIVSGLLLWSVPPRRPNGLAWFGGVEPHQHRILTVLHPPALVIAAVLHAKAFGDAERQRADLLQRVQITGAGIACLFFWRLGLYVDSARRNDPIKRSILLLCGTALWTATVFASLLLGGSRILSWAPLETATYFSAALLWPALGFLIARDVRPKHLIS